MSERKVDMHSSIILFLLTEDFKGESSLSFDPPHNQLFELLKNHHLHAISNVLQLEDPISFDCLNSGVIKQDQPELMRSCVVVHVYLGYALLLHAPGTCNFVACTIR